jgi:hypothetical protein
VRGDCTPAHAAITGSVGHAAHGAQIFESASHSQDSDRIEHLCFAWIAEHGFVSGIVPVRNTGRRPAIEERCLALFVAQASRRRYNDRDKCGLLFPFVGKSVRL